MKKLFTLALIGAISTITLTSCSNTGTADLYPEGTNQTKQSKMKASAKEVKELPELTEIEEFEMIEYAKNLVEKQLNNPKETISTERARILCSTNMNSSFGHACVWNSSGHLVNVSWQPKTYSSGENTGFIPGTTTYSGTVVSQCNC